MGIHTSTTVPQDFKEKWILTWVPLDTPLQEVLMRERSRPPTRSFGMLTSIELDLHSTGTTRKVPRITVCTTKLSGSMSISGRWGRAIHQLLLEETKGNHYATFTILSNNSNLTTYLTFPSTQHKPPKLPLPQILLAQLHHRRRWSQPLYVQQKLSYALFPAVLNTQAQVW